MSLTPGELVTQDPDAHLVYGFDWSAWLADAAIAASTFAIAGPDEALVFDSAAVASGGKQTSLRISGGTLGATYEVVNRITTDETPPQIDDRAFRVQVLEND